MFCSKCGNQIVEGASFCHICSNPVGQQLQTQIIYIQTPKPKIPGRGLGISGMVLGIIGLVYAVSMLSSAIDFAQSLYSALDAWEDGIAGAILVFSVLSILAVSLAGAGRVKGYKTGVSMSGLVMGIIGVILYLASIFTVLIA